MVCKCQLLEMLKINKFIMYENIYLGFGCLSATKSGKKLIIDCWRVTTSMVVSNLYCYPLQGNIAFTNTIAEQVSDNETTEEWKCYISPNTYFIVDVQSQHDVIFYWDGVNVFEVASAWFGGGDNCFSVSYKGQTWNNDIPRKKLNFFKGIKTPIEWSDACKQFKNMTNG